jgi:hypothetical protein
VLTDLHIENPVRGPLGRGFSLVAYFDSASGLIRPVPHFGAGPFPSAVHGVVPFDFGSGPFWYRPVLPNLIYPPDCRDIP